jgi:hypothetical protein
VTEDTNPGIVLLVKFKSALANEELVRRYKERRPEFQALPGLVQKYYIYDATKNEWGGVYLWDSKESLDAYLASDLRKSIPDVYEIVGEPKVEMGSVVEVLR